MAGSNTGVDPYLDELARAHRPKRVRTPAKAEASPSLFDAVYPPEEPTTNPNPVSGSLVVEPHPVERWSESGASEHEPEILLLIPIAQRLAREAGEEGVIVADVRAEAVKLGLLPPLGKGRSLSYLGCLGRRAGLKASKLPPRRSHIEGSNGNRQTVWVLREVAA